MIRYVAYRKAVLAGMTGAVAWEAVARPLILAGVPFVDIVGTLGSVALPHAGVWTCWIVGMTLHLIVGAIWAVFYAYFFWSVLPLRPVLQGFVFAFVPMPLAIFIMHPQLELMHPLVQAGQAPSADLFGLSLPKPRGAARAGCLCPSFCPALPVGAPLHARERDVRL